MTRATCTFCDYSKHGDTINGRRVCSNCGATWPTDAIRITREICAEFDKRTEPWATSDLAEAVECSANVGIRDLPGAAFDRWMKSLNRRDARGLDYDSRERHNARCLDLGRPDLVISDADAIYDTEGA
jgi:hypothetical protein